MFHYIFVDSWEAINFLEFLVFKQNIEEFKPYTYLKFFEVCADCFLEYKVDCFSQFKNVNQILKQYLHPFH